jgi:hypothetical protein
MAAANTAGMNEARLGGERHACHPVETTATPETSASTSASERVIGRNARAN